MSETTTVSANASDNVGVSRVELYVDGGLAGSDTTPRTQIAWNTTRPRTAAIAFRPGPSTPRGNVGSSAVVNVTVSNSTGGGGQLIVNGGFEGSASPWDALGGRLLVDGRNQHSGTGYDPRASNNASGSEYQTVNDPGASHPANLTFWLNITTSESLHDGLRLRLFV